MKIPEFNSLQLTRTETAHTGKTTLRLTQENSAKNSISKTSASFGDYLLQAFQNMNNQQIEVNELQQKVVTDPESVDLHDVTIAVAKARMSLNLANSCFSEFVLYVKIAH